MNVDDNKGLQEKSHLKQRILYSQPTYKILSFPVFFLNNFHSSGPARHQKAQAGTSPKSVCDCVYGKACRNSTASDRDQYTHSKTDPTILDAVGHLKVEDYLSSTLSI